MTEKKEKNLVPGPGTAGVCGAADPDRHSLVKAAGSFTKTFSVETSGTIE